jgi:hypothetical protein
MCGQLTTVADHVSRNLRPVRASTERGGGFVRLPEHFRVMERGEAAASHQDAPV